MEAAILSGNLLKQIEETLNLAADEISKTGSQAFELTLLDAKGTLKKIKYGRPPQEKSETLEYPLPGEIKLRLKIDQITPQLTLIFERAGLKIEKLLLKKELDDLRFCCETVSQALPHLVTIHDAEMRIIKVNRATCEFLGLPQEEILGRKCYEIFHQTSAPPEDCPALKLFRGEKRNIQQIELFPFNRIVQVTVSALIDKEGQLKGYVHIVIDLTEKKELEEKLILAQKLEALGTLAGGIAHDFNNLLTPILGFAEIALLKTKDSQIKGYLSNIISCAKRAKELIAQIKAFSHQGNLDRKPLLIETLVKEGSKLIEAVLPNNIEIKTEIKPCGYILGNPTEIQQILLNLASNAFYAMKERGGVLTISLEPKEIEGQKFACLTVADTGIGIPPEIMPRIFDPYFTTKPPKVGTGLGLAVVQGIVKNSGGQIEVKSKPGQGTTFKIYLPLLEKGEEQRFSNSIEVIPGEGEIILLLEDDEQNLKVLEEGLRTLGYKVIPCQRCEEALLEFFKQPEKIDLFLTDLLLPGARGDSVAKVIKESRPDLPVILLTGFNENIEENGTVDKVLMKPVALNQLAEAIRQLLTKKCPSILTTTPPPRSFLK